MNSTWRIIALNPDRKIGGVWRLSDDKKFYLGHPTPEGPIVGFEVYKESILVRCGRTHVHGIPEISRTTILRLHELY